MYKIAQAQHFVPCLPSISLAHGCRSHPLRVIGAVGKGRAHSAIFFSSAQYSLALCCYCSLARRCRLINSKSAWSSPRHSPRKNSPSGKTSEPGAGRSAGYKRRRRMEALSSRPRFLPWIVLLQFPHMRWRGVTEVGTGMNGWAGGVIDRQPREGKKRYALEQGQLTGCP